MGGDRRVWSSENVRIPLGAWGAHRERLATGVDSPDDWDRVWEAMVILEHVASVYAATMSERETLSDAEAGSLYELHDLLMRAESVLRPLAGGEPYPLRETTGAAERSK